MDRSARANRSQNNRKLAHAAAAASMLMLSGAASAQILYWDLNGATLGIGGAGTWDTTTANWSTDPLGQVATQAWATGNIAQFSAGTTSTGTFTVTVPSGVSIPGVNGIVFEEGVVTIAGADATANLAMSASATFQHGAIGSTAFSRTNTLSVNMSGDSPAFRHAFNSGIGTFILNNANTFTGTLSIAGALAPAGTNQTSAIVLDVRNANALGTSVVEFGVATNSFTTTAGNSQMLISGGLTLNNSIILTGNGLRASQGQLSAVSGVNTWNGTITINGASNVESNQLASIGAQTGATLIINGQITNAPGAGSLTAGTCYTKVGAGTVVLATANPGFVGFNRIFNGVLKVTADGALGAPSVPGLVEQGVILNALNASPTLAFGGNVDYNTYEVITTGGQAPGLGNNGLGMIHSSDGNNRFAGDLRLGGPSTGSGASLRINSSIGVAAGSTLDLAGKIFASSATSDVTPRIIRKIGAGTLVISGENNGADGQLEDPNNPGSPAPFPQYATRGTMQVDEGTLVLRSASATGGSLKGNELGASIDPGSMDFRVNPGATLFVDNSLAVNTDRFGSNAQALLTGGNFQLGGNASTAVTQSMPGGVRLASYSTMTVTTPGATTTLDLGSSGRDGRGTGLVRGMNGTSTQITSGGEFSANVGGGGGGGSPLIGIVPSLVGDASATGSGTDFVTYDVTNGLRVLTAGEYAPLVSGSSALNNVSTGGTPAVTSNTTVNSLKMAAGTAVTISAGSSLTNNSGAFLVADGAASSISGGTLDLGREGTFHVLGSTTLTVGSAISGPDGITKSGTGVLVLTGNNTYFGDTTINAGVLEVSSLANLGNTGNLLLNGGTFRPTGSFTYPLGRGFTLNALTGGTVEVAAGQTVTVQNPLDGAAGGILVKTGAGTLFLDANSTAFNAAIRIDNGVVAVNAAGGLGTNVASLIINGGTLALNGTDTIGKAILLNSASSNFRIAPGQTGTFSGVLSGTGNIVVEGGGTFTPTGNNLYTGVNTVNGGSTMHYPTSIAVGVAPATVAANYWTLNDGTLSWQNANNASNVVSTTINANRGITVTALGGAFRVEPIAVGTGTWHTVILPAPVAGVGTFAKVGAGTLQLTGSNTSFTGRMQVNEGILMSANAGLGAATASFGFGGGTLQATGAITGTRAVDVGAAGGVLNSSTFAVSFGDVSGPGNLTKIGSGNLTVTSYRAGGIDLQAGNLVLAAGTGAASAASASQIGSNGSGGTLAIATGSSVNVTNNALMVNYTGTSPRAALEALVAAGFAGGSWNGIGINSTTAASTVGSAVGIAEATDIGSPGVYAGQTIDNTTVIIRYTRSGDATMDGTTNISDFSVLAANFNTPGRWATGDFNYDGSVNIGDFSQLAANFNLSVASDPARGSLVPEPASLGVIAIGSLLAARRRR